ncbi:MAG: class I SAM-dependent methyltransferase [Planctomycetota bacterium]
MRERLLQFIECKRCNSPYELTVFRAEDDLIEDGLLKCKSCGNEHCIVSGIPRFVPIKYLRHNEEIKHSLAQYRQQFKSLLTGESDSDKEASADPKPRELKERTAMTFGFEWRHFREWGWIEGNDISRERKEYDLFGGLVADTENAFKTKCILDEDDISEHRLVLDAGCGNGRFTNIASRHGAEICGVDIGYGVQTAYNHLKNNKKVHIIQGDLFSLPFREKIFDSAFSVGVLMHTGNAKSAFHSISKHIRTGGVFVAHLYHKGNFIFEIVDSSIRFITTRMSVKKNMKFAGWMAGIGKRLKERGALEKCYPYIRVLPTVIHMYDWYSAPVATHHTYKEVRRWYEDAGFEIVRTNEQPARFWRFLQKPESLTIKGKRIT